MNRYRSRFCHIVDAAIEQLSLSHPVNEWSDGIAVHLGLFVWGTLMMKSA
jgi:hypothetical protein